jgi:MFS family permease
VFFILLPGVIQLVGPFASLLANILGMRTATIIGAVVSAAGFFISTFVYDVTLLLLFFGIVAGTGLGLMYVPAVCSVGYWFDKKRAFATGVVTSGTYVINN